MKTVNRILLLICLIILIIGTFSANMYAFSYPLKRFIENDKEIRILLKQDLMNFSFIPVNSVKVIGLGKNPVDFNLQHGEYEIEIVNPNNYWQVQIFATNSKKRAQNIKEKLHRQGYKGITINRVENLYKVLLPGIGKKQQLNKIKTSLINDGWNPWVKKIKKTDEGKSLCLLNSNDEILCQGINIIIKGDIYSNNKKFPGEFEFLLTDRGIRIFNTVDLNSTLLGISCYQFSHLENIDFELLKAQTVINRTYILNKLFNDKNNYKDIPFYRGIYGKNSLLKNAIYETEGEVLASYDSGRQDIIIISPAGVSLDINYRKILEKYLQDSKILNLAQICKEKTIVEASIAEGLKYSEIRQLTWWGPRALTLLDMDINKKKLTINTHLANNKLPGLVDLQDTVRTEKALAGINGGFFSYTGRPLGFLIVQGMVVSEPLKNRTILAITDKGDVLFGRLDWRGILTDNKGENKVCVTGVNRKPNKDEVVIYNKFYGQKVKTKLNTDQLLISTNKVDKRLFSIQSEIPVPESGYIIQASGDKRSMLANFCSGDFIIYSFDFIPDSWDRYNIVSALEAGPRLLKNGKIHITAEQGDFNSDIVTGRAPRSAVGLTTNNHLLFVTVDGRQPKLSIGMTLSELAEFMKKNEVNEAINLDGGYSARMVVRGYTMNNPGKKRLIANEIIIK